MVRFDVTCRNEAQAQVVTVAFEQMTASAAERTAWVSALRGELGREDEVRARLQARPAAERRPTSQRTTSPDRASQTDRGHTDRQTDRQTDRH